MSFDRGGVASGRDAGVPIGERDDDGLVVASGLCPQALKDELEATPEVGRCREGSAEEGEERDGESCGANQEGIEGAVSSEVSHLDHVERVETGHRFVEHGPGGPSEQGLGHPDALAVPL